FTGENLKNVKRLVAKKTDLTNIWCIASHSHSAPGLQEDFPSKKKPYVDDMEAKIADAIIRASWNMQPASLGLGMGRVEEGFNRRRIVDGVAEMFWVNRERAPTTPVDYSLGLIRVNDAKGAPIAHLVNFQCHPVVLGPENLDISADYPGYMMAAVEKALGGQAMFMQGAAGDINPFWDKTPPAEGAFEQCEKMGLAVADEVIRVSKTISDFDPDVPISFSTEVIPLAHRNDIERRDKKFFAEVNTVVLGDSLALATFPGEFFVEHGLHLKSASKVPNTFFIGYCNGRLRYFPTIKACTEGGYGAASATQVEVGAGERLVNRAIINLHYQAEHIRK
ncbi:MAG: hypothetical protein VCB26_12035, partial [Candidatus Hydrogenedentota bacterium]